MTVHRRDFGDLGPHRTAPTPERGDGPPPSPQQPAADVVLATVGHELACFLGTGDTLADVCRLTVEALQCDYSCILLRQPHLAAYVPVACHGITDERWDAMCRLKLSDAVMSGFVARCAHTRGMQIRATLVSSTADTPLTIKYGGSASIHTVLRRGAETIGLMVAGYRHRPEDFTPRHRYIARGIAQLGAIAQEAAAQVRTLRQTDALKSEFVATVSHELRTPLNTILGYNDLLLEQADGQLTPPQYATLKQLDRSARQLLDVINTLLDLSRLEHGRVTLDLRTTDLGELLREIAAETRPLCEQAGLTFAFHLPPALAPLCTDATRLKVLLRNLVLNAFKFTGRGSVTVTVTRRNGGVEIAVADTGTGMTPATLQRIFEPFQQAGPAQRPGYGGVGLGLFIVRRIVEVLGGTICVDSCPGRGSTFRVWLAHVPPPPTGVSLSASVSTPQQAPSLCAAAVDSAAFPARGPIADAAALD